MFANSFGTLFRITTFGESHGKALGVTIDGCPPNIVLNEEIVQVELDKRKPGQSNMTTARKEEDKVEILSGVFEGVTTGTPITMIVYNEDKRSQDYSNIMNKFRPGHADYTYYKKYGIRDYRGGGRSSARETVARVAGGAVAKQILAHYGISVYAHTVQIGNVKAKNFDITEIEKNKVRTADKEASVLMEELILDCIKKHDSVGGIVELVVKDAPVGLGEPIFDRLDARLSYAIMSIPAVKGVEFGAGFGVGSMFGSQNNDRMTVEDGFLSNNSGGVLGGISTGQDIVLRFAVKPTSSLSQPQKTIQINSDKESEDEFENTEITTTGRHDPCIVPRVIPIAEAMTHLVLVDFIMLQNSRAGFSI